MDAASDRGWNEWAQVLIKRAIDERTDILIDATVEYIQERLTELREEIAALRADLALHSGIARGEIADIKRRKDNAA